MVIFDADAALAVWQNDCNLQPPFLAAISRWS